MERFKPIGLQCVSLLLMGLISVTVVAQVNRSDIRIRKATASIAVDGDLSDAGWQDAARVDDWYETNPGDNVTPAAASVAWLTYDDRYFYAAFEFSDPNPKQIRAPYGDQDNISIAHDYAGIFLDAANDGKTAMVLLTTARGVQYDAVTSDVTGLEDSTPDFFWESIARLTPTGWVLEMRVPFTSLRYPHTDPQTWGILLYRNWPRNHRTTIFASPMRRGANCIVCQTVKLTGLEGLPRGGQWSVAPYATARQMAVPSAGSGSSLDNQSIKTDAGVDAKWTPNADTAVDITINPDFSQVEADVAQISVNERFALLFPEKRPFFLEGKDLFATPISAVHTRTVTEPDWGLRATGRVGTTSFTVLAANDVGGGQVVIPSSTASTLVDQDFGSIVGVARMRYDIGRSFVSFLATARELNGVGYNRVYGPDFGWRPSNLDRITGQVLFSHTQTPERTDLAAEWDGRKLSSHAARFDWSHSTPTIDWFAQYRDFGDEFRADNGYVPQVGYRSAYLESGYTFRPKEHFFTRLRTFAFGERVQDRDAELLAQYFSPGVGMDGGLNSFMRFRYSFERVRSGEQIFPRDRWFVTLQTNPSQTISRLQFDANLGQAVDFTNSRPGHGGSLALRASLRPTDRLELGLSADKRWVNVTPDTGGSERRLFVAYVSELRATHHFNGRSFVRLIGQYVTTERNPALYLSAVEAQDKYFSGTGLFSYKLNWQSVLYLGYGDERALDTSPAVQPEHDRLDKIGRQWFLKVSYAFQNK